LVVAGEVRESHLAAAHDSSARQLSLDNVQAPRYEIVPCVLESGAERRSSRRGAILAGKQRRVALGRALVDKLHNGAPVRNREHRVSAADNLRKEIRGSGICLRKEIRGSGICLRKEIRGSGFCLRKEIRGSGFCLRKEIRGSGFRFSALGRGDDLSDCEPVCRGCNLPQDEQGQAESALSEEQRVT